jgi:hypothetical protein
MAFFRASNNFESNIRSRTHFSIARQSFTTKQYVFSTLSREFAAEASRSSCSAVVSIRRSISYKLPTASAAEPLPGVVENFPLPQNLRYSCHQLSTAGAKSTLKCPPSPFFNWITAQPTSSARIVERLRQWRGSQPEQQCARQPAHLPFRNFHISSIHDQLHVLSLAFEQLPVADPIEVIVRAETWNPMDAMAGRCCRRILRAD